MNTGCLIFMYIDEENIILVQVIFRFNSVCDTGVKSKLKVLFEHTIFPVAIAAEPEIKISVATKTVFIKTSDEKLVIRRR